MMNNVTAKDLRDAIEVYWDAPYYEDEDDRLNREGRRDAELAAFDAMAEKAELWDKHNNLCNSGEEPTYLKDQQGRHWIELNSHPVVYHGATPAEALKAVPE